VALARALARRPRLLLLDEPLAALDKKLREATQAELVQLQRRLGTSFVIVTHDQDEAMTMADRIAVMRDGKVEQVATPRALYETPASRWVAGFVGDVNLIDGRVIAHGNDELTIAAKHDFIRIAFAGQVPRGADVGVAIRPEKMRLMRVDTPRTEAMPHRNARRGTVAAVSYLGGQTAYTVTPDDGGAPLRATLANTARRSGDDFAIGERVIASFAPADAVMLMQ
jgi:putrescine transport system ATP-binding protein